MRLFKAGTGGGARRCPACERSVGSEATFCPFCYMVFRPEGASDLRRHLHGERVPADVYLRRKMQAQDPDAGPVVRLTEKEASAAPEASVAGVAHADPPAATPMPLTSAADDAVQISMLPAMEPAPPPAPPTEPPKPRMAAGAFTEFPRPLPPLTESPQDVRPLLTWMLQHDPIIPNHLVRLEAIHANVFRDVAGVGYEQHIVIQVVDDLWLHERRESLQEHLQQLAIAYRRTAQSYSRGADETEEQTDAVLWQMASLASRLRMEAWVYRSRYGDSPQLQLPRRRSARRH